MPSDTDPDAALLDALLAVHAVLEDASIQHALCGGIAANLYRTELRATTDVDLYIVCATPQIIGLARRFEEQGWTAHPAWQKAELLRLERHDMPRVDLLIAATEFERRAVERAVPRTIEDKRIRILAPEDLMVFKLVAGRARDYEAVAAIVNTQGADLDVPYVERMLAELGIRDRWTRVLEEAELEAQDLG